MKIPAIESQSGVLPRLTKSMFAAALLPTLVLLSSSQPSPAGSATWNLNADGLWHTSTNWTPATVPNGPLDTATFDVANTTDVFVLANTEVNSIVFDAGASAFTIIAISGFPMIISGVGITNNSGSIQNFKDQGSITFTNSASAGSSAILTNDGGVSGANGGFTNFFDTSTAGNSTCINNAGSITGAFGGLTSFYGTSTAGTSTLISNSPGLSPRVLERTSSSILQPLAMQA